MSGTVQLSPRRRRFVEEYLVDLNGTQAAIRAGYRPAAAKVTASRLLTDDNVSAAVAGRQKALSMHVEVTAERVVKELAALAFANMTDFIEVGEDGCTRLKAEALADRSVAAAVSQLDIVTNNKGETRTRLKLANKLAALVELAQRLGLHSEAAAVEQKAPRDIDKRRLAMAILAILREGVMAADAAGEPLELEYLTDD